MGVRSRSKGVATSPQLVVYPKAQHASKPQKGLFALIEIIK